MPLPPRLRLPRRRPPALRLSSSDHEWYIVAPDPDQPMIVAGFGDAALLATEITSLPVQHEALVLLDEQRRVTAMLLDAPAEIGLFVGLYPPPGVEAPFCQTMAVVLHDHVPTGPPEPFDRDGYLALRRLHMTQGLLLLDVLITDGDTVRSLAIGCDPDPIWYDEFAPNVHPTR
jgi:hypothetical protein